jgi:uncharacterized protein YndB with AHSA1/START domain
MVEPIDVTVSRDINASADTVWAVLSDLNRLPEWLEFAGAVENVSGPAQAGATYTVKPPRRFEPTTHWEVAEVQQPARQLHTSEMPIVSGVRSELELSPTGRGVTVQVHWSGMPKGLLGTMMRPIMAKRIPQNWEQSLENLAGLVEGAA